MNDHLRIAIVIASTGRPEELGRWIDHVARQSLKPVEMIWSIASPDDVPEGAAERGRDVVRIVTGPKGTCKQRNTGMNLIREQPDLLAFFDDDYVPSEHCLAGVSESFKRMSNVAGLSGRLLADGVNSPGISYEDACDIIGQYEASASSPNYDFSPLGGLYGCNMVCRWSAAKDIRFDERLPLYGWQEDFDFSTRLAEHGLLGRTDGFVGVHQGAKGGRSKGRRLGYSQVVNPAYLCKKGTMKPRKAWRLIYRNLIANHVKMIAPESWIDRRGRVVGNWIGIIDVARGKLKPERVLDL